MNESIKFSDFISLGTLHDLEILASDNDCVLWIRNKEYDKQLYVSNTYTNLWEQDCLILYKDPLALLPLINTNDPELFYDELKLQRTIINPVYTKVFSITLSNGKQRWFQDRSFQLPVSSHHEKIIAGCALHILDKNTIDIDQENISERLDLIITKYYQLLTKIIHLEKSKASNSQVILAKLSKREKEIFLLFLQGKTITQVATTIHLSPRTVEGYLITLKTKLLCESKSELIMKAIENGWLSFNLP